MRRFRQTGLSVALLALAAAATQACATTHKRPKAAPSRLSRLVVVQADYGFVIRGGATPSPEAAAPPTGPIPLGNSVQFDRGALLHSTSKDIANGETR